MFTENKVLYFANKHGKRGLHIKATEPATTTLSGIIRNLTSSGHLILSPCPDNTGDRYAKITKLGLVTLKLEQLTSFIFEEHEKVGLARDIIDLMKDTICEQTNTTPEQIFDAVADNRIQSVTGNADYDKIILKFLNKARMIYSVGNRKAKGIEHRTSEAIRIAKENDFYTTSSRQALAKKDIGAAVLAKFDVNAPPIFDEALPDAFEYANGVPESLPRMGR